MIVHTSDDLWARYDKCLQKGPEETNLHLYDEIIWLLNGIIA